LQVSATASFQQPTSATGLRERKKQQTRANIAAVAAEIFDSVGYAQARTAEIAERAEVSEATLFRYFPTKADLAVEHVRWTSAQLIAALTSRPASETPYEAALASAIPEAVAALVPNGPARIVRLFENDELAARTFVVILESTEQVALDFSRRLQKPSDSPQVRVLANAAVGVVTTSLREWIEASGPVDILAIFRRHLEVLQPVLDVPKRIRQTTKESVKSTRE
jgi:AcrR family transcriptional regulator